MAALRMVVVAGPSGSGKSTHFPVADLGIAHFNVDDRCAELNDGSYAKITVEIREQAQRECEAFVQQCILEGRSFAVETTLRTPVALSQATQAREAGFRLEMVFVATDSVDENVLRVARRGHDGGHSAPEARIREIYERSLSHLPRAIELFDEVLLFDTTEFDHPARLVARIESGMVVSRESDQPTWCRAVLERY